MAYVPHNDDDREAMLAFLGLDSLDGLFRSIPESIRLRRPLDVPPARSETEILRELGGLAARNRRVDEGPSFLGAGCYRRFIPAAIDALSSRGEFSTTYTPYQPEVSQGTLQAIIEYQTMLCALTGMDIANASMYDGATALAESVLMSYALRGKGRRVIVSEGVHPEYRRVLDTYVNQHPIEVEPFPLEGDRTPIAALESMLAEGGDEIVAVVVQTPNFFGSIEDTQAIRRLFAPTEDGSRETPILIAIVDPIALALLDPPGDWGADIAIGDGQQLGNYPSLGGPSFGFFTTRHEHVRKVPGRIVGETLDRNGKRGYVLTFQTREQHIRRERATSNICTNQGLCSLRGAMYMAFLGKEGLREVAAASVRRSHDARRRLLAVPGIEPVSDAPFFHEFAVRFPISAREVYRELARDGIGGGLALGRYFPERENEMLLAFTELTTAEDVSRLEASLNRILSTSRQLDRSLS